MVLTFKTPRFKLYFRLSKMVYDSERDKLTQHGKEGKRLKNLTGKGVPSLSSLTLLGKNIKIEGWNI
jgi:hypothetical protein